MRRRGGRDCEETLLPTRGMKGKINGGILRSPIPKKTPGLNRQNTLSHYPQVKFSKTALHSESWENNCEIQKL